MLTGRRPAQEFFSPAPAFCHRRRTIDDIVDQTIGRALDLFGLDPGIVKRWKDEG